MGYSSQAGQVLLKTQATPGVLDPDLAAEGIGIKLRGGSLGPNRELLVADAEIGGGRDVVDAYLGAVSWAGSYDFYARFESLLTLLNAALGTTADGTPAGGVTTHTITGSDTSQLPFLSIEERIGAGLECFNYTDAVVNTLHLEAEANGFLMGTCDLIAAKQVAGATFTPAPDWDDSPMTVGTNITVTYNGVTVPAKSFSLDINNNFEDDDFRMGSFYLGDLTAKQREVNGSFTIRPENSAQWRQAVLGGPALTTVGGLTTKQQLVITASTYEFITGSTVSKLTFTLPKVALEPFGLEPSGDDIIENDVSWRALRPVAGTGICSAAVINGKATVA